MQETVTDSPIVSEADTAIEAAAVRAEAWAGQPVLHPDEGAAVALAPGTARRRALDDAIAEIERSLAEPSFEWKVRYALMLGLERVLSEKPPRLRSGTELRRHQIDALAGMLTELIAAAQKTDENGNGNGSVDEVADEDEESDDELELAPGSETEEDLEELPAQNDPGAVRR